MERDCEWCQKAHLDAPAFAVVIGFGKVEPFGNEPFFSYLCVECIRSLFDRWMTDRSQFKGVNGWEVRRL